MPFLPASKIPGTAQPEAAPISELGTYRPSCHYAGSIKPITLGERPIMRALELIAALVVALLVFVAIKLIGLVLHIALIGAAIGLIAGFLLARALRRS
ncbi:MAG: hypothetical protein P4L57_15075 [Rhizomicrobium sp.]|nr:hypothetical protein [Rhizomicrobium sp.]